MGRDKERRGILIYGKTTNKFSYEETTTSKVEMVGRTKKEK